MKIIGRESLVKPFTWLVVALGAGLCLLCIYHLPIARLHARFLFLSLFTIILGPRLTIQVPRAKVHISLSDSFVFLTLLVYGGEAAVLLAAAEAFSASLHFRKKRVTIRFDTLLFNSAMTAISTFLTFSVLHICFGSVTGLPYNRTPAVFISALSIMALVQYIASSSLAAFYTACEAQAGVWATWNNHYFSSSITYIAGATATGVLIKLVNEIGFYAIVVTTPIIALVYFTHRRYINDIKASAAQAEQAERERAEAERARAEAESARAESERERAEQFRYAAFHDALTNLPNRALLTEKLKVGIERAKREAQYQFAVLFLCLL
jgi:hypothetical protein